MDVHILYSGQQQCPKYMLEATVERVGTYILEIQ